MNVRDEAVIKRGNASMKVKVLALERYYSLLFLLHKEKIF